MRTIALLVSASFFGLVCIVANIGVAQQKDAVAESPRAPAQVVGGTATLAPENTRIQFVGTHNKKDPEPRTGVFTKFTGKAAVDAEKKALKSISFEIQTASLETPIGKLTNHLRSPDFFDVRQYPTAKFESSSIKPGDSPDKFVVTGKLNLLKGSKELSIPVVVNVSDKGLNLISEFKIDRTDFGMSGLTDMVNKEVAMTVKIGSTSPAGK